MPTFFDFALYELRHSKEVAMLTSVGTITVHVSDQDKALAFYTEKLGFETRADMPMGPDHGTL